MILKTSILFLASITLLRAQNDFANRQGTGPQTLHRGSASSPQDEFCHPKAQLDCCRTRLTSFVFLVARF